MRPYPAAARGRGISTCPHRQGCGSELVEERMRREEDDVDCELKCSIFFFLARQSVLTFLFLTKMKIKKYKKQTVTHLRNQRKDAEPSTRLRTPDSCMYRGSASATPSPSTTTVSTCARGEIPFQSRRNTSGASGRRYAKNASFLCAAHSR